MRTTFKEEDNDYVMYFEGRLDTSVAAKVEKELQPLAECSGHDIVLDCSKLEYISSSGLRLFLGVLKKGKAQGSHVYIKGLSEDIRSVFKMTGFINLFEYR